MKKLLLFPLAIWAGCLLGQNQNISNGNVFDGEPFLVVNPNNPQHIVTAWMSWIDFANQFQIKTRTSFDGGQTWSNPALLPHTVSGYSSADPTLDFNQNGDVFAAYIDFTGTTPPVTGGIFLCHSTDGGLSWGTPREVVNTSFDGTKWPIDRPWLAVDRSPGPTGGNIYVTSMNLNRTNAPFNPYVSVSTDTGITFTTTYLDTTGYLAGSLNPLPMPSPAITANGNLHAIYPSYVVAQSPFIQNFLATSTDGGQTFSHQTQYTFTNPSNLSPYPSAKKAGILIAHPTDPNHLATVFLTAWNGDLDVFFMESTDGGNTWSTPERVNDDPVGNNRMQDLLWADFDSDGDIIVGWRDRRNGSDSTYAADSEIWAAYRHRDSSQFAANFPVTTQVVAYDSILENAGNDFMGICLDNDTLSAVWGDVRNGKLNIWFQRMLVSGVTVSIQQIAAEDLPEVRMFPNPAEEQLWIQGKEISRVRLLNSEGKVVYAALFGTPEHELAVDLSRYPAGVYVVEVRLGDREINQRIVIP